MSESNSVSGLRVQIRELRHTAAKMLTERDEALVRAKMAHSVGFLQGSLATGGVTLIVLAVGALIGWL